MKKLIIGVLVIAVVVVIVLCATGVINFGDNQKPLATLQPSDTEVTLQSGENVQVAKEYFDVIIGAGKVTVQTEGYETVFNTEKVENNSEMYLTECFNAILDENPEGSKTILISNTPVNLGNDRYNELIFAVGEKAYLILHYTNDKVYAYALGGYKANGDWKVDGTASFSSSAFEGGITKYTFDGTKLNSEIVAKSERAEDFEKTNNINYELKGNKTSQADYDSFILLQNQTPQIEFIQYSAK